MKTKSLYLCGVAAPLVYLLVVVIGDAIRPGYSHIANAISELIAAGAPNKTFLDVFFLLYNGLITLAGIGLFAQAQRGPAARLGKAGAACIIGVGLVSILMTLFFPMDARGTDATLQGTIHLIIAGLESLGSMAAMFLIGLWQKKQPGLQRTVLVTFICLALVFLAGITAGASAASGSPFMGLFERITIGAFLLWVLVFFTTIFKKAAAG